jgi:hypothetical protein
VVVDVFDAAALRGAVAEARPEVVMHQLTDLPHALEASQMEAALARNARLREEGTRNLVAAAVAAGSVHVDAAARAAVLSLTRARPGIYNVAERDPSLSCDKAIRDLGWDAGRRPAAWRSIAAGTTRVWLAPPHEEAASRGSPAAHPREGVAAAPEHHQGAGHPPRAGGRAWPRRAGPR